ncbi:WGxxGxxG family protein [Paenibacillus sinopodophylli]|uniref:WGxxGxxG family protein n=1 Tax=Paenibacillus sinopodophylli TaxID=1837342 RepID=UPI00110CBFD3|nr:WGxxGxxG family protein [Paenibacillus sinopodophylli]
MKKFWSLFCLAACLTLVLAVPAFGDNSKSATTDTYTNRGVNNSMNGTDLRTDIERGVNNTTRALDVDTRRNLNANNYRTNAVDNDNDFNWSWLGLLGLIGLAGLRNRGRERT